MAESHQSETVNDIVRDLFKNAARIKPNSLPTEIIESWGLDITSMRDESDQTLLHVAAGYGNRRLVDFLIYKGADTDAQDVYGQSPLHFACNHAHNTVAKILIEAGADVNLTDVKGWSPLDFTLARKDNANLISQKYWEVLELLLLSGADPYKKSHSGRTCFDRVKDSDQRLLIRLIHLKRKLEICDDLDLRLSIIDKHIREKDFFELIKKGDTKIVSEIITPRLVRSHLSSFDNITPLHRAAGYNHLEIAELLLKNGADVNATDDDGQIPLHNAARYCHIEMIELLVSEGCKINHQDIDGMSPLHLAASSDNSSAACLSLIHLGADIALRNLNGKLPIDLAKTDDVREVLKVEEVSEEFRLISASGQAIYMGVPDSQSNDTDRLIDELMLDSRSNDRLFSNPNHAIKKIILNQDDPKYQLVKYRMLSTIRLHSGDTGGIYSTYEIITIERILHEKVWQKYKKRCEILDLENVPRCERLLFHGSNFIDKIQQNGFDHRYAQPKGMFGAGIYFAADSSKSNQYTFGFGNGCLKHHDKSCYICDRKIIYAQVALGKSLIASQAEPDLSHPPPGFWSVSGEPGITKDLQYPEYVIYDGHQAYPLYVITYRIKS